MIAPAIPRPYDELDVRLTASAGRKPWLCLVEGMFYDQVATEREALAIGAEAARDGARVVVLRVEGRQETWRLIRTWGR